MCVRACAHVSMCLCMPVLVFNELFKYILLYVWLEECQRYKYTCEYDYLFI